MASGTTTGGCEFSSLGASLLGVDVEDASLLFGEGGAVVQHRAVRQGRRGEGRDVESLLALGLPDRGAEVAQRPDHGAVHSSTAGDCSQASAARTGRLLDAEGQLLRCRRMVVRRLHRLPVFGVGSFTLEAT